MISSADRVIRVLKNILLVTSLQIQSDKTNQESTSYSLLKNVKQLSWGACYPKIYMRSTVGTETVTLRIVAYSEAVGETFNTIKGWSHLFFVFT